MLTRSNPLRHGMWPHFPSLPPPIHQRQISHSLSLSAHSHLLLSTLSCHSLLDLDLEHVLICNRTKPYTVCIVFLWGQLVYFRQICDLKKYLQYLSMNFLQPI